MSPLITRLPIPHPPPLILSITLLSPSCAEVKNGLQTNRWTNRQTDRQRDCNIEMQGHIKKCKGVMNKQPHRWIGQQTDLFIVKASKAFILFLVISSFIVPVFICLEGSSISSSLFTTLPQIWRNCSAFFFDQTERTSVVKSRYYSEIKLQQMNPTKSRPAMTQCAR